MKVLIYSQREFIRVLKYKSNWLGKKVIEINRYYSSSQSCNRCGFKNEAVKNLSVRKWICPECGLIHDKDINASINIMLNIYERKYNINKNEINISRVATIRKRFVEMLRFR